MQPLAVNESGSAQPLQHVAYLHDGTLEGLLCCIFEAYVRHEDPEDIVHEKLYQPRFEQSALFVASDFERAQRVRRGVEREAGFGAFGAVMRAAASDASTPACPAPITTMSNDCFCIQSFMRRLRRPI